MRILALDPAARTGYCWSDGRIFDHGYWLLGNRDLRPGVLADHIGAIVAKLGCDCIAFEIATFGSRFAYVQAQHNELAGAIRAAASALGVQCWGFTTTTWKARSVGKGNAKIHAVKSLLRLHHDLQVSDNDEAAAIGVCLAAQQGPPPEPAKKAIRRQRKAAMKEPRLFR